VDASNPISYNQWIQGLAEAVRASPSLTDVSLGDATAELISALPFSAINKFELSYFTGQRDIRSLASVLPSSPSLSELTLSPDDFISVSPLLLQLPASNLTNLCLESELKDEDWRTFAAVLPQTRLSSLLVDVCVSDSFPMFCSALPQINSTLTFLSLLTIDETHYASFAAALSQLDNLQGLYLDVNVEQALPFLLPCLGALPVQELTFFVYFDALTLTALSALVPTLKRLKSLDLSLRAEPDSSSWRMDMGDEWKDFFVAFPPSLINLSIQLTDCSPQVFGSSLEVLASNRTLSHFVFFLHQQLGGAILRHDTFCPDQFAEIPLLLQSAEKDS
jgi:hypothetical protein